MIGVGWPIEPPGHPAGPEGLLAAAVALVVGAAVAGYVWWAERTRARPRPGERDEQLRKAA